MAEMKRVYADVCQMIAGYQYYQAFSYLVDVGFDKTTARDTIGRIRKERREEGRKVTRRMRHLQRLRDDVKSQLFGHL